MKGNIVRHKDKPTYINGNTFFCKLYINIDVS